MGREILFAEVPGFYAAVERADDPTLARRPVIVGGDPRKRGRVQAATAGRARRRRRARHADARGAAALPGRARGADRHARATARSTAASWRRLRRDRRADRELRPRRRLRRSRRRVRARRGDRRGDAERRARGARRCRCAWGSPPGSSWRGSPRRRLADEGVCRVAAGHEDRFLAPLPVARLEGVGRKTAAHARRARRPHDRRRARARARPPARRARRARPAHPRARQRARRRAGAGQPAPEEREPRVACRRRRRSTSPRSPSRSRVWRTSSSMELARNGVAASRVVREAARRRAGRSSPARVRWPRPSRRPPRCWRRPRRYSPWPAWARARCAASGSSSRSWCRPTEGDRQLPLFPGG